MTALRPPPTRRRAPNPPRSSLSDRAAARLAPGARDPRVSEPGAPIETRPEIPGARRAPLRRLAPRATRPRRPEPPAPNRPLACAAATETPAPHRTLSLAAATETPAPRRERSDIVGPHRPTPRSRAPAPGWLAGPCRAEPGTCARGELAPRPTLPHRPEPRSMLRPLAPAIASAGSPVPSRPAARAPSGPDERVPRSPRASHPEPPPVLRPRGPAAASATPAAPRGPSGIVDPRGGAAPVPAPAPDRPAASPPSARATSGGRDLAPCWIRSPRLEPPRAHRLFEPALAPARPVRHPGRCGLVGARGAPAPSALRPGCRGGSQPPTPVAYPAAGRTGRPSPRTGPVLRDLRAAGADGPRAPGRSPGAAAPSSRGDRRALRVSEGGEPRLGRARPRGWHGGPRLDRRGPRWPGRAGRAFFLRSPAPGARP